MKTRIIVCTFAFLVAAACASARPAADACQLLTKRDVAAVQGEEFTAAQASARRESSQCFYQLPTFMNSISVVLMRDGREYWRENFEGEREAEEAEEEEHENKQPPRAVSGVGEEAFWTGSAMTGSLYVLYRDSVVRISVGGKGTEEEKIARAKKLAARALRKL